MLSYRVKCAILILGELKSARGDTPGLRSSELKIRLGFPRGLQQLLLTMKNKGLLRHDAYRGWYSVSVDLDKLTLWDLIEIVDDTEDRYGNWPEVSSEYPRAVAADADLSDAFRHHASALPLSELIQRPV